jgi:hypothetical protein
MKISTIYRKAHLITECERERDSVFVVVPINHPCVICFQYILHNIYAYAFTTNIKYTNNYHFKRLFFFAAISPPFLYLIYIIYKERLMLVTNLNLYKISKP